MTPSFDSCPVPVSVAETPSRGHGVGWSQTWSWSVSSPTQDWAMGKCGLSRSTCHLQWWDKNQFLAPHQTSFPNISIRALAIVLQTIEPRGEKSRSQSAIFGRRTLSRRVVGVTRTTALGANCPYNLPVERVTPASTLYKNGKIWMGLDTSFPAPSLIVSHNASDIHV